MVFIILPVGQGAIEWKNEEASRLMKPAHQGKEIYGSLGRIIDIGKVMMNVVPSSLLLP